MGQNDRLVVYVWLAEDDAEVGGQVRLRFVREGSASGLVSQPRTLAWWASVLESVSVDEPLPRSKKSWATVGQLVLTRDPTS